MNIELWSSLSISENEQEYKLPHPKQIISVKMDGTVESRYEDDTWVFDRYSTKLCRIFFRNFFPKKASGGLQFTIIQELKAICWCLFFTNEYSNRQNVKPQTLKHSFELLKPIVKIAYNLGIPLSEAHASPEFLVAFKASIGSANRKKHHFGKTLKILKDVVFFHTHLPHIQSVRLINNEDFYTIQSLLKKKLNAADESERTPLIPTRIFSGILTATEEYLNKMLPFLPGLEELTYRYANEPYFWHDRRINERVKRLQAARGADVEYCTTLKEPTECLKECGLETLDFTLGDGSISFIKVRKLLGDIQDVARLGIHAYTGMRAHEVNVLPFNTIQFMEIDGLGRVPLIKGKSSKMSGGNYAGGDLLWVTCDSVISAINAAQSVARCALNLNGYEKKLIEENAFPLFPSLEPNKAEILPHYSVALTGQLNYKSLDLLNFDFLIRESDMVELETFDAFTEWRESDRFKVGNSWLVASHQFRRSVAVYAARSGMVSLPSLQTQFKHLSIAMTLLYSSNSTFSRDFILETDGTHPETHFVAFDFVNSQKFNQMIKFEEDVINNSHRISGGKGARIQRLKDTDQLITVLVDRKNTEQLFLNGQLNYTQTVVGGCMKATTCKDYGVSEIVPCWGCGDSVSGEDGGKKIINYKQKISNYANELTPGSPAHREAIQEIVNVDSIIAKNNYGIL